MNKFMIAATALMFATLLAHVFGGGPEIHAPIQASELSPYLRAISAVIGTQSPSSCWCFQSPSQDWPNIQTAR